MIGRKKMRGEAWTTKRGRMRLVRTLEQRLGEPWRRKMRRSLRKWMREQRGESKDAADESEDAQEEILES